MRAVFASLLTAAALTLGGCGQEEAPPLEGAAALPALPEIASASEFVGAYPERAEQLLASLNLDYPGLEDVKSARNAGDAAGAAEALALYYRRTEHGAWLKTSASVHAPDGYDNFLALAPEILRDDYTFQSVSGAARRFANGRIDWAYSGPNDDLEWASFLNSNFHLIPLLKAHAAAPDAVYGQKIDEAIHDWVTSNDPAAAAEGDSGAPLSWHATSVASRLLQVWPQAFYLLQDEPGFSDAGRLIMLSSVPEQAERLKRRHQGEHSQSIRDMVGLAHAAAAWPEFAGAPAWSAYALEALSDELDRRVYPTGAHNDLAAQSHRAMLEHLMQYVQFMRAAGFAPSDAFEARVATMADYLAHAMRPDGTLPLNNESDLEDVRGLVLTLADVFDRNDWRYKATNGEQGTTPAETPSRFDPYAGQLVSRSDWDAKADWSVFDIGLYGASHQHRDRLHLSISSGGRDLLVDIGGYAGASDDPFRAYFTSSRGHNVILIDERGQNEQAVKTAQPMVGVAAVEDRFDVAFGVFDDGYEGVEGPAVHRRAVAYVKDLGWIVADDIETDRQRRLTAQWHFHPDVSVMIDQDTVVTVDQGLSNLRIDPAGAPRWLTRVATGETEPVRGWYSPARNTRLPAPVAVFDGNVIGSRTFGWVITTAAEGVPKRLRVTALPAPEGALRLQIEDGMDMWEIAFRLRGEGVVLLSSGYILDGRFAMVAPDGTVHAALTAQSAPASAARRQD